MTNKVSLIKLAFYLGVCINFMRRTGAYEQFEIAHPEAAKYIDTAISG